MLTLTTVMTNGKNIFAQTTHLERNLKRIKQFQFLGANKEERSVIKEYVIEIMVF